jgi:tyrosine-protein phosphatase YwqE
MTEPFQLKEFIFAASTKGYRPVLAHPERYMYLQDNFEKAEDLINRGVLFQLNISSISGYYSKGAQRMAQKLIDNGWVHLIGSDCHNVQHIQLLEETIALKYFQKAISLPLLNNSL